MNNYLSFPLYSLGVLGEVRKLEEKNKSLSNEISFLKEWVEDLIREGLENVKS